MNYNETFKFRVNISSEYYETKEISKATLTTVGAKSIGKNKMSFKEKEVTAREMLNYAVSGYSFAPVFEVNPNVKYCITGTDGKKSYSYPVYSRGANKGALKLTFKRDEFFKSSSVVFLDIDNTKYPTIPDYLNTLEFKPTFCYPSYSDNIQKNGITSRRFRMAYVFNSPMSAEQFRKANKSLNCKTEIDTAEELDDKCNEAVSQYFNGVYDCTEKYYTGIIYDYSDFIDPITDQPKYNTTAPEPEPTETKEEPTEKEITYSKAMFYDMCHLDYDRFMIRWRRHFHYSYDNSNPNGWIKWGETEIYYQFVGEDYFELYWNVNRVQDGQKRRKKVYERMCLRKLMNPEISLDTLMFCAYEDIHRFFDNSDNVLNPDDYILRNATNAYKMKLTEIESKYSDNIAYLRQTSNPKDHIILKSGSAAGGQANLVKSEIKFSLIDGIYDTALSVKENLAKIEAELFPISKSSLYEYCKSRKIDTKQSKNELILEAYDPEISLRKNWDYINKNVCKVSLGKLSKLINLSGKNEHSKDTHEIISGKNEHLQIDNTLENNIPELPEFSPISFDLPKFESFWGTDITNFKDNQDEQPLINAADSDDNNNYNSFGFSGFSFLPDSIDNYSSSTVLDIDNNIDNTHTTTTQQYYTTLEKMNTLEQQPKTNNYWGLDFKFNLDPTNLKIGE